MLVRNEASFQVASTIVEQGEHSSVIPIYNIHVQYDDKRYNGIIKLPYFPLREAEEIAFSAKLNPSADPKQQQKYQHTNIK